jgi:hypothetical protein
MKKFESECDVAKVDALTGLTAVHGSELAGVEGGLAPLAAVGIFFLVHAIAAAAAGTVVGTAKAIDAVS